jgi:hypothetical protein
VDKAVFYIQFPKFSDQGSVRCLFFVLLVCMLALHLLCFHDRLQIFCLLAAGFEANFVKTPLGLAFSHNGKFLVVPERRDFKDFLGRHAL